MWAFIIAGIVFVGTILLALYIGAVQGMADAPQYDDTPFVVFILGGLLSAAIFASHWLPHIGW